LAVKQQGCMQELESPWFDPIGILTQSQPLLQRWTWSCLPILYLSKECNKLIICNILGALVKKILQNMDSHISQASSYNMIAYSAVSSSKNCFKHLSNLIREMRI